MRTLLAALLVLFPSLAFAQGGLSFTPYAGYNFSSENFVLGVAFEKDPVFNVGAIPVGAWVDVETQFVDNATILQANANLTPTVVDGDQFDIIVGVGLAFEYASFSVGGNVPDQSDTAFGFNALGGVEYDLGSIELTIRYRLSFFDGGNTSTVFGGPKFKF